MRYIGEEIYELYRQAINIGTSINMLNEMQREAQVPKKSGVLPGSALFQTKGSAVK
jgi:hypothetical protein